jgi:hypothetical protein
MNDLHELVHALEPDVPTLTSTQVDRQRARLMTAAQAEVIHQPTSSEVPEGARTSTAPKRRTRRRHVFFASALTGLVAAGVIVALVVVQPGPGGPRTAAAAVLDQAAAVAGQQSPGPGQYLYTETQSTYQMTNYKANSTTGALDQVATASYGETDQSWTDAAGTGQVLRTYGAAVYSSVADQMEFLATNAAQGGRPIFGGQAEPEAPAIDVSDLPTDPTTLGPVLAAGQMGTSQYIAAGPDATFERAARLLIGPTTGMSPTLASALFQVMADQPGARSLGTVTDHDGEQGEGVALGDATNTQVAEVIVDPDQGRLLEVDYAVPGTTSAPPGGAACANSSSGLQWCCGLEHRERAGQRHRHHHRHAGSWRPDLAGGHRGRRHGPSVVDGTFGPRRESGDGLPGLRRRVRFTRKWRRQRHAIHSNDVRLDLLARRTARDLQCPSGERTGRRVAFCIGHRCAVRGENRNSTTKPERH